MNNIMPQSAPDIDELEEELKSKSEIKREMHKMQDFAQSLVEMSKHQRSKIPLTEALLEDMVLADKIKGKHEAVRRHIRHMAKVLMETDLEPIHHAIDVMNNKHQQETAKFVHLENIRDALIEGNNETAEEVLTNNEKMERQKLKQLIRQAKKEKKAEKIGKYTKVLFNYLKANLSKS
ncbi:MAG: DUF615 domain-containing protein [Colwellia sp.]|nr:DUF615 domain-containing protein [Colwellia sp.]